MLVILILTTASTIFAGSYTIFTPSLEDKCLVKASNIQVQALSVPNTAVFYQSLCEALQKRDPALLLPLLADTLYCDFADGLDGGYHKSKLVEDYFKDAKAEAWTKFELLKRMGGFGEFPHPGRGSLIAPFFPDTVIQSKQQFAYVFADNVRIRASASHKGKVIGRCSRAFVQVDTDALCYDNVDPNWLPINYASQKAYVSIDLSSWSKHHGYMEIHKRYGVWKIVSIVYGRHPRGTWHLPGCC